MPEQADTVAEAATRDRLDQWPVHRVGADADKDKNSVAISLGEKRAVLCSKCHQALAT
jgi:hypothetical protein